MCAWLAGKLASQSHATGCYLLRVGSRVFVQGLDEGYGLPQPLVVHRLLGRLGYFLLYF